MNNTFPNEFYDYSNGALISKKQITEWLDTIKERLASKEDTDYSFIASGNTIVFGFKFEDGYTFYVADRYKELSVGLDDFKELNFK